MENHTEPKKRNFFQKIYDKLVCIFHDSKFGHFWSKSHLQYFVLAALMYGFKAVMYFIVAYASNPANAVYFGNPHTGVFAMEIDNQIPIVSYFYFFYLLYYIVPEIFLWVLSFYDKKKVYTLVIATIMASIVAGICYVIQQVKMIRPEAEMSQYEDFSSVYNLDTFFKWAINKQYHADETALNCFPSLHATVGMTLSLVGIWTGKDEKHFPIGWRIFCTLFGLCIVMSTFFVKQHYFIDAVVGAILMVVMYFVVKLFIVPPFLRRREKKLQQQSETKEAAAISE